MKNPFPWPLALLLAACQPSAEPAAARPETPVATATPKAPDTAATPAPAPAPTLPAGFRQALAAGHLTFRAPAGTVPVPVLKNAQMDYDYAVGVPGKHVEIRYAIRPLGPLLAEYRQAQAKGEDAVDPNELHSTLLTAVALNISGGEEPLTNEASATSAQREFGADWGATTLVRTGKGFASKYAKCMIVALHKRNAADAYCFYLFDNPDDLDPLLGNPATGVLHALRFQ